MEKKTNEAMKHQYRSRCLSGGGGLDRRGRYVVSFMAPSSSEVDDSFYLEAVYTGAQGYTAEWITEDITRVMDAYPETKWAGEFLSKFFQGCCSHGLDMLVIDILYASKAKGVVLMGSIC